LINFLFFAEKKALLHSFITWPYKSEGLYGVFQRLIASWSKPVAGLIKKQDAIQRLRSYRKTRSDHFNIVSLETYVI
jgi:hypothetical protein